jgi:hypothetical protein
VDWICLAYDRVMKLVVPQKTGFLLAELLLVFQDVVCCM